MASYFLDLAAVRPGDAILRHHHPDLGLGWLHFTEPLLVESAQSATEVIPLLDSVQAHADQGRYCVGCLTYECGAAFDEGIVAGTPTVPFWATFAIFDREPAFYKELEPFYAPVRFALTEPDLDREAFGQAFDEIKRRLAAGDAYQVNLTFRLRLRMKRTGLEFFSSRCGVEPPPHSAYLSGPDWELLCFSPELFFSQSNGEVVMKPMKGTAPATGGLAGAQRMASSPKTRAENLMITDMVRNDLGRIAEVGSVQTPHLFTLERHRTVYQVTSTVRALVPTKPAGTLQALMPAASVTGAPKVAACKIIHELERSPRNVYCGAIGWIFPGGEAKFAVGIRTAFLNRQGVGEYGIGAGIVWDSVESEEHDECELKAQVLGEQADAWELRESFGKYTLENDLVDRHAARMARSAEALKIKADLGPAFEEARAKSVGLPAGHKIVVGLRRDGSWHVKEALSTSPAVDLTASVAREPVGHADPSLRIKTNSRAFFAMLRDASNGREVLLVDDMDMVTEFTNGAALFRFGEKLLTHHPWGGCLDSVTAKFLVDRGVAEYSLVSLAGARRADEVFFANAVVGIVPVTMIWDDDR